MRQAALCGLFALRPPTDRARYASANGVCTKAGSLVRALSVLLPAWRPITGFMNQLDLVRFRPVEVLQSYPLSI